jgi:cold shock protein
MKLPRDCVSDVALATINEREREYLMSERVIGKVSSWKTDHGYGFAVVSGQPDVFIHFSAIDTPGRRHLDVGETVEFEIVPGKAEGQKAAAHVVVL